MSSLSTPKKKLGHLLSPPPDPLTFAPVPDPHPSDPLHQRPLSAGPPASPARPLCQTTQNFALFFPTLAPMFALFFSRAKPRRPFRPPEFPPDRRQPPPGLHTTARELQTCTSEGPGASNTTKIPREDARREKKTREDPQREKWGWDREKSTTFGEFWASHLRAATPPPFRPSPFEPPPHRAPTLRSHTIRAPFGAHPSVGAGRGVRGRDFVCNSKIKKVQRKLGGGTRGDQLLGGRGVHIGWCR